MPNYTHTTLAQARSQLASRLNDPDSIYWSLVEKNSAIVQAIRMWQAATGAYRKRGEFNCQASTSFYNLADLLVDMDYTVTDRQVLAEIRSHLLEPVSGDYQFTSSSITKALQRRLNQFLLDSGQVLAYYSLSIADPPDDGRVALPDTAILVSRAAWITQAGRHYPVFRDDEFSSLSFNPDWPQSPGLPQVFSPTVTPPVTLQLIPPPDSAGNLEMLIAFAGPALDPDNAETVLVAPDDWCWAIKYGALADLLATDGPCVDPTRAQYCEQLYQAGVGMAKLNPSVLLVQIDGEAVFTGSVFELDAFSPSWQDSTGTPGHSALAGRNMFALSPTPNATHDIHLDIVPNIPVPSSDLDYLQVGREMVEVVLDEAQHICSFKQGGAEFLSTLPLHQNFMRMAAVQNNRLSAQAFYRKMIEQPALKQGKEVPTELNRG